MFLGGYTTGIGGSLLGGPSGEFLWVDRVPFLFFLFFFLFSRDIRDSSFLVCMEDMRKSGGSVEEPQ